MPLATPSLEIKQLLDKQELDTVRQVLEEECKKLQEKEICREELYKRGEILVDNYRALSNTIYYEKWDTETALTELYPAEKICKEIFGKISLKYIQTINDIAYYYDNLRQFDKARAIHKEIIPLAYLHPHPEGVKCTVYNNIAFGYMNEGEYKVALRYFEQARIALEKAAQHAPEVDASEDFATSYCNLGKIFIYLKNYVEAQKKIKKGIKIVDKDARRYIILLTIDASCDRHFGNYASAISSLEEALKHHKNNVDTKSPALLGLAQTYADMQNYDKAIAKAAETIQFLESTTWDPTLPRAYQTIAQLYLQAGQYEKAHKFVEKALQAERIDNDKLEILYLKTKIQYADYQLDENVNHLANVIITLNNADNIIDNIRCKYQTQASRLLLAEQAKDLYERGIETAFLLYKKTNDKEYVKTAFRYAEKSKAILLLMEIRHQDGMLSVGMSQETLQQEKDILRRLNYLDKTLEGEQKTPKEREKQLKEERFKLQDRHKVFLDQLEQDYPNYYQQKYNTEPTGIADLQRKLSDNRLIINYFVGEKNVYIFRIGKKYADIERVGEATKIRQQVIAFREMMEDPTINPQLFEHKALALYDTLLKSTLSHSKVNQLLIIPDDVLTQLPFEALVARKSNDLIFSKLNYLLNDYEVTYHFSATLWHYGLKKYERQQRTLSFVGFAPMYGGEVQPEQVTRGHYKKTATTFRGAPCHELPFAKQEVEQIGDFFKQKKLCVDEVATKENFLVHCTQGDYLHIAAHGFYSKDKNEGCYIQFSPSEDDDIELNINDIAAMKIDAHLIVLSCCNTGQGQFRKGESVFALNRSFMAAGGKNVISTFFKVPDALACELMTCMYEEHLGQEKNISPALRDAKRQLIQKEGVTPIAWCGYQLVGS